MVRRGCKYFKTELFADATHAFAYEQRLGIGLELCMPEARSNCVVMTSPYARMLSNNLE